MSRSTNPTAYAKLAANTFLFAGIPEEDVHILLAHPCVRVEHYEKDQVIFDRTDTERVLGIILYGSCAVTKESESGKMPMSILRQTDLFGAASLFHDEEAYVARVTANESTWVLLICEDALRSMMQKDFRLTENYLRYLTARIRFLSGQARRLPAAECGRTRFQSHQKPRGSRIVRIRMECQRACGQPPHQQSDALPCDG